MTTIVNEINSRGDGKQALLPEYNRDTFKGKNSRSGASDGGKRDPCDYHRVYRESDHKHCRSAVARWFANDITAFGFDFNKCS